MPGKLHQGTLELFRDDPWLAFDLADHYELSTVMVVVSYDPRMSAALRTWSVGPPPKVDVMLLDAETVPKMLDLGRARAWPTAAVLSATVHACRGDIEVARVAIRACKGLPEKKRDSYTGTILAAVDEAQHKQLMEEANVEQISDIWEIERRSGSFQHGRREGRKEGQQQGRREGRRVTLVEMIEALLDVRGIAMTPAQANRVRSCRKLATLERWARRAREVANVDELFADG